MGRGHVCGLFSKDKIEAQLVHCAEIEDADPDVMVLCLMNHALMVFQLYFSNRWSYPCICVKPPSFVMLPVHVNDLWFDD